METLAEKWSRAKARNTTLIEKDLRRLESQGNWEGTEDVRDAIANYRDIVRGGTSKTLKSIQRPVQRPGMK